MLIHKGQVWIGDFVIGIGVFFLAVLIFVVYLGNVADNAKSDISQLSYQAKILSNYLVGTGFPKSWEGDPINAKRVGLSDGESRVQWIKFNSLQRLNYSFVKQMLNTNYDFFLFFEDERGDVLNIGGYCGFGDSFVHSNLSAPKLGWLANSLEDDSFGGGSPGNVSYTTSNSSVTGQEIAHIYRQYKTQPVTNGINASTLFLLNLTQPESINHRAFDIIYVEANTYNWSQLQVIENYVYNGGKIFIFDWWCNEKYPGCADGDSYTALGVNFTNTIDINYTTPIGFNPGIVQALVVFQDPFLHLQLGLPLWFNGFPPNWYWGTEGELNAVQRLPNSSVFQGIAIYQNHTDSRFNVDIGTWSPDSPFAYAYWRFGAGWAYYFPMNRTVLCNDLLPNSSFIPCTGGPYNPNSALDEITNGITPLAGRCSPVNTSLLSANHLVTSERLMLYDDKFVKMVVYLWD